MRYFHSRQPSTYVSIFHEQIINHLYASRSILHFRFRPLFSFYDDQKLLKDRGPLFSTPTNVSRRFGT